MQETQEMQVQSLGWEDPLEEGNPLQYSCLENPMDKGAWKSASMGKESRHDGSDLACMQYKQESKLES